MIGTTLAHYQITAELGKGGMGEVWKARDTKLGREVAIKTLPEEFASDADRLARFEREAKLLASLNHPNIAAIYGLEEHEGARFLVLELVEGDTLAERIKRGALSIDETLPLAQQIVEALEAAHEKGVIHRDLKPANIKVTPEGKVKVLDFGLAKALTGDTPGANLSQSPTLSMAATAQGVILGTAAYMSPEQARGVEVDKRADIWAFGCVLYEMLTGRQVFGGELMSDVMASVLKSDPNYRGLPTTTPPRLRALLQRCLQKDPKQRWHDVGDLRVELQLASTDPAGLDSVVVASHSRGPFSVLVTVGIAAAALTIGWFASLEWVRNPTLPAWVEVPIHTDFEAPEGTVIDASSNQPFQLSPDGTAIAFVAISLDDNVARLWLRPLDSESSRMLPETEGAHDPCWAPDSERIAFYAPGGLKWVQRSGEDTSVIVSTSSGRFVGAVSCAWGGNDIILFKSGPLESPFERISLGGGAATLATRPDDGTHRFASFLEDGDRFIYMKAMGARIFIELSSLSDPAPRVLAEMETIDAYSSPAYTSGFVLYAHEGDTLAVESVDEDTFDLIGDVRRLVEGVPISGPSRVPFSVSSNGVLAYQRNPSGYDTVLRWYDRDGNVLGHAVDEPARYYGFDVTREGDRLAYAQITSNGYSDIHVLNLVRGDDVQRTFEGINLRPVWSTDQNRLAFAMAVDTSPNLSMDPLSTDPVQLIRDDGLVHEATDWDPDDNVILFNKRLLDGTTDVTAFWLEDMREESLSINTGFDEFGAVISPDSEWVAYVTNREGSDEVWIAKFPSGEDAVKVSIDGGTEPRWRGDGLELFFISSDHELMAVSTEPVGSRIEPGTPAVLFRLERVAGLLQHAPYNNTYSVTGDGRRFLVGVLADTTQPPIHVIFNWPALLEE